MIWSTVTCLSFPSTRSGCREAGQVNSLEMIPLGPSSLGCRIGTTGTCLGLACYVLHPPRRRKS